MTIILQKTGLYVLICNLVVPSTAWVPIFRRIHTFGRKSAIVVHAALQEFHFFDFDEAKVSYRKCCSSARTTDKSDISKLLLIHPIGIGQASWFWDRFMTEWFNVDEDRAQSALYAVNLLGCGVTTEMNAMWKMTKQTQQFASTEVVDLPVSLPILTWVQQCETMIHKVICPAAVTRKQNDASDSNDQQKLFFECTKISSSEKVTIVAQGGLAPVAILLAARNPAVVKNLVLLSPPSYNDLRKPVPASELRYNYNALRNILIEKIAFSILESQWAIQFFSNLFLFSRPCDSEWLNRTILEAGSSVRRPVQLFNAGYCSYRSYEDELTIQIRQPTLILRGHDDNRNSADLIDNLQNGNSMEINGRNVLPWESAIECCLAVKSFLSD